MNYQLTERTAAWSSAQSEFVGPERPENKALLDYWLSLRHVQGLPARRQIEPRRIQQVLPHLVIIDVRNGGAGALDLRVRLAGTALRSLLGIEATGKNWLDLVAAEDRPRLVRWVHIALTQPAGYIERVVISDLGERPTAIETLVLPISEQPGDVPNMLLCATVADRVSDLRPLFPSLPLPRDMAQRHFIDLGYGLPRL